MDDDYLFFPQSFAKLRLGLSFPNHTYFYGNHRFYGIYGIDGRLIGLLFDQASLLYHLRGFKCAEILQTKIPLSHLQDLDSNTYSLFPIGCLTHLPKHSIGSTSFILIVIHHIKFDGRFATFLMRMDIVREVAKKGLDFYLIFVKLSLASINTFNLIVKIHDFYLRICLISSSFKMISVFHRI